MSVECCFTAAGPILHQQGVTGMRFQKKVVVVVCGLEIMKRCVVNGNHWNLIEPSDPVTCVVIFNVYLIIIKGAMNSFNHILSTRDLNKIETILNKIHMKSTFSFDMIDTGRHINTGACRIADTGKAACFIVGAGHKRQTCDAYVCKYFHHIKITQNPSIQYNHDLESRAKKSVSKETLFRNVRIS